MTIENRIREQLASNEPTPDEPQRVAMPVAYKVAAACGLALIVVLTVTGCNAPDCTNNYQWDEQGDAVTDEQGRAIECNEPFNGSI